LSVSVTTGLARQASASKVRAPHGPRPPFFEAISKPPPTAPVLGRLEILAKPSSREGGVIYWSCSQTGRKRTGGSSKLKARNKRPTANCSHSGIESRIDLAPAFNSTCEDFTLNAALTRRRRHRSLFALGRFGISGRRRSLFDHARAVAPIAGLRRPIRRIVG